LCKRSGVLKLHSPRYRGIEAAGADLAAVSVWGLGGGGLQEGALRTLGELCMPMEREDTRALIMKPAVVKAIVRSLGIAVPCKLMATR
jgi:hypothetical protein